MKMTPLKWEKQLSSAVPRECHSLLTMMISIRMTTGIENNFHYFDFSVMNYILRSLILIIQILQKNLLDTPCYAPPGYHT